MLEFIVEMVFPVVLWVVFFPVLMVGATPVVLIWAIFLPGSYSEAVPWMYRRVAAFWAELLPALL